MAKAIVVQNLKKYYAGTQALSGVNWSLEQGEECVIVGASGSGKSTLLYLLAGLERATEGQMWVGGQQIDKMKEEALAHYRNTYVGLIFQFHFLLPTMNCLDNVLLPAKIGGRETPEVRERIQFLAKELGVTSCLNKYPYQLSGGEQQRINIMRALSLAPPLLLCDEPTGNLDSANSQKVITLIRQLAGPLGCTLVVVTHDLQIAQKFSQHFIMRDGVLAQGLPNS